MIFNLVCWLIRKGTILLIHIIINDISFELLGGNTGSSQDKKANLFIEIDMEAIVLFSAKYETFLKRKSLNSVFPDHKKETIWNQ